MILSHMANRSSMLNQMFAALSDPTRRTMVERLVRGPASVSELARPLPMSLPTAFQHLKVLEASGLVRSEKKGRVRTCRIDVKQLDAARTWLGKQRAHWEARFDRLDALLEKPEDD
jgi:DNA-binding transcriptional ArsR family regulator